MLDAKGRVTQLPHRRDPAEPRGVSPDGAPVGDARDERDVAARASEPAAAPSRTWSLLRIGTRILAQLILPLLLIAGGFAGYRYMKATKPETPKQQPREQAFTVALEAARIVTVQPRLELFGTTVAGRQVEIRALVAGRVSEAGDGLRSGAEVATGDRLLTIDRFDYELAVRETEAQLAEARAKAAEQKAQRDTDAGNLRFLKDQLRLAEVDLQRAEPLSRQGTVTARTVDDRRIVVSQRRQAVTQLENNVEVWTARIAQQAAAIERLEVTLERNRQRLQETALSAPFNAYVTDVGAQVGRMLSVNDRVATLIDRDWIEVRFTLTDRQFGRLVSADQPLIGRKIEVRWNVGAEVPVYAASIERVGARVTADSGGIEVFARIDDPLRPVALRPGAFVEVQVPDVRFEQVVRVASSAVYQNSIVYVAVDGRMRPRKVEVVGADGSYLLVRGEIAAGEQVIVNRVSTPGDGVRVQAR